MFRELIISRGVGYFDPRILEYPCLIITFNLGGHNKIGGLNFIGNHSFGGAINLGCTFLHWPSKKGEPFKALASFSKPAELGQALKGLR